MSNAPVVPVLRAAVFTAVCVGLSACAHQAMSQTPIPLWALAFGSVGVYASARFGARRGERGLAEIALLMGVLQVALHLWFDYAQQVQVASAPASAMTGSMPGMAMPGSPMSMPMPVAIPVPMPSSGGATQMGAGMLIAHVLAALMCAWWLRRGEAAVHAVARTTARWLLARLAVPTFRMPAPVRRPEAPLPGSTTLPTATRWLRSNRALRGPPRIPSSSST